MKYFFIPMSHASRIKLSDGHLLLPGIWFCSKVQTVYSRHVQTMCSPLFGQFLSQANHSSILFLPYCDYYIWTRFVSGFFIISPVFIGHKKRGQYICLPCFVEQRKETSQGLINLDWQSFLYKIAFKRSTLPSSHVLSMSTYKQKKVKL